MPDHRFVLIASSTSIPGIRDRETGHLVGLFFRDPKQPGAAQGYAEFCVKALNVWDERRKAKSEVKHGG